MKNKINLEKLTNFLFEIGTMRKIARSHRQTLLTNDLSDNISSHSFRVTMIGLMLAQLENVDVKKVLIMCLTHDISEVRSGDQNWVHKKFVKVFEDEIINSQMEDLPDKAGVKKIIKEYQERKSLESKIAKDADLIDQILLLKEYEWQGNQEAQRWLKGKAIISLLSTASSKKLVSKIYQQNPSDWWSHGGWSNNRR
ncbi:HD domain-containing protein [Candidatus Amesbacteria bacterium]|nr:HD domain-containing protein [Candidatus Amesbacteria bacterium]